MNLKQKMNLSWIYEQYITGMMTGREVCNILRDFGYTPYERVSIYELLKDKKEDEELDTWQEIMENEAETDYWSQ